MNSNNNTNEEKNELKEIKEQLKVLNNNLADIKIFLMDLMVFKGAYVDESIARGHRNKEIWPIKKVKIVDGEFVIS